MSLLRLLGLRRAADLQRGGSDGDSIRKIAEALDRLEPARARYLACYAYLLGRVAHADRRVSPEETRAMERLVMERGGLPEEQAVVIVQMAKTQNRLFGGTEDFLVTREFNEIASYEQKVSLLHCLFAVSSSDEAIGTVEDNEIRRISRELRIDHHDFVAVRARYRQHLRVLQRPEDPGDPEEEEEEKPD